MKKAKWIVRFSFLVPILFPNISFSQYWTKYTIEDGLAGNSAAFIQEDAKGYLWFTTEIEGTARFDGTRFQLFPDSLASNNIYCTHVDNDGNIWFGTDRGASKFDGYIFQTVDASKGLIDNTVNYILRDKRGNLWFGTDNGLSLYDGKSFKNFSTDTGLPDNFVSFILEDHEGNLWFSTGRGIAKFDGKNFQALGLENLIEPIMHEDKNFTIWFGTETGIFKKLNNSLKIDGPLKNSYITSILEDQKGNLWFASENEGVIKYNLNSDSFDPQNKLPGHNILSMCEDNRHNIWFGTEAGIFKYDGKEFLSYSKVLNNDLYFVKSIHEDQDQNLWFGTQNGVFKFTVENIWHFTKNKGLIDNRVNCLVEDKEGNIWIGTKSGLSKFSGTVLSEFEMEAVNSILVDRQNNLWCGTSNGLTENFKPILLSETQSQTTVKTMIDNKKGKIFFETTEGVYCFDNEKSDFIPIEGITSIYLDSQENLWIGSFENGIYKYTTEQELKHYTKGDGLACNHISWIYQTHDENLWFGLKGTLSLIQSENIFPGGICRFDGERFWNYSTNSGLISNNITAILEDKDGYLWLGTDVGVMKHSVDSKDSLFYFRKFSKKDGLISNYITTIDSDKAGNLWFCSDKGVTKFSGENFQSILLEKYLTYNGRIENLYEDSGGVLWFVTSRNGIIRYLPPTRETRPRVHVTKIEADKTYNHEKKIRVPTAERIIFEYRGISLKSDPGKLKYQYMLEGLHQDWQSSSLENRFSYPELEKGEYTFKVVAIDQDLHVSDPPATVTVEVYRPFSRSLFFIFLAVILGICFIGASGYYGTQLKRQRKIADKYKEKIKKQAEAEKIQTAKMDSLRQLVAGVAHELNNPIGAISSNNDTLNRAVQKIREIFSKEAPPEVQSSKKIINMFTVLKETYLANKIASDKIATTVANLRSFVRLDEAEWQNANIHEGLNNSIALIEPEIEQRIKILKEYGNIPEIYCSPRDLNQVFITMLRNASEAIKNDGVIKVKTFVKENEINIEISDTGIGISPKAIDKIFDPGFTTKGVQVGVGLGLSICHKIIVDEHKGHIDVASKLGKGAIFTITLPRLNENEMTE